MSQQRVAAPRRIGFLVFNDMTALDVAGPMEAFASARMPGRTRETPGYELLTIGLSSEVVTAESGLMLRPATTLAECPALDTLIIPGGRGLREGRTNVTVARWIKSRAAKLRRIASVCTGIFGLAATHLLDGQTVTTHWRYAAELAQRFPLLTVDANALYLRHGKLYTSAGITAGIDLSLALIEEDYGRAVALMVARELVVFMKRPGGQRQYSEPLRFQSEATDRTAEIAAYIRSNLDGDLSVGTLATRSHLSYRQFSRRFRAAFGCSPAAYVEALRLEEACTRLCETGCRIEHVADALGFGSDDAFRRAFERRFGVAPGAYRERFGAGPH